MRQSPTQSLSSSSSESLAFFCFLDFVPVLISLLMALPFLRAARLLRRAFFTSSFCNVFRPWSKSFKAFFRSSMLLCTFFLFSLSFVSSRTVCKKVSSLRQSALNSSSFLWKSVFPSSLASWDCSSHFCSSLLLLRLALFLPFSFFLLDCSESYHRVWGGVFVLFQHDK